MFRGVKMCSTFVYTVLIFAEEVPNDPLGCDQSVRCKNLDNYDSIIRQLTSFLAAVVVVIRDCN